MNVAIRIVGAVALGTAFGAATSLSNAWSHEVGLVDGVRVEAGWAWPARVASLTVDSGWAWAALAVAVGWLAGARLLGAVAGALALLVATTTYYAVESAFLGEPFVWQLDALRFWSIMSVVLGPALGVVGACIRRPGLIGLLAGLTVPVGATAQMILMPPRSGPMSLTGTDGWARLIVLAAAAVAAAVVLARFRAEARATAAPAPVPT